MLIRRGASPGGDDVMVRSGRAGQVAQLRHGGPARGRLAVPSRCRYAWRPPMGSGFPAIGRILRWAAVAAVTPPAFAPFAHDIAFDLMALASIVTVLFDLNPLMKYDGYDLGDAGLAFEIARAPGEERFGRAAP